MKRHLIVKLSAIGDVAFAAPAVQALHDAEGGEIHWVCGDIALPLVQLFPFVHQTYSVSDRRLLTGSAPQRIAELAGLWRKLAGMKFDTCAVLHADKRWRLTTLPVRAERFVYLEANGHRDTSMLPGRSQSEELRRILLGQAEPIEELLAPVDLTNRVTVPHRFAKQDSRRRIAIVPGGAKNLLRDNPQRRWPIESYRELATHLIAAGHEVALVGAASDRWASAEFAHLPVLDTTGQLSLPELIGFYTSCDLIVSADTGPLHMARLTRVPVIALYGPQDPKNFFPKGHTATVLWGGKELPCRPCYDGREFAQCSNNLCMKSITVPSVVRSAEAILRKRSLNAGSASRLTLIAQ